MIFVWGAKQAGALAGLSALVYHAASGLNLIPALEGSGFRSALHMLWSPVDVLMLFTLML